MVAKTKRTNRMTPQEAARREAVLEKTFIGFAITFLLLFFSVGIGVIFFIDSGMAMKLLAGGEIITLIICVVIGIRLSK